MLKLKAPAKINWFLRVKGRRPDGYHEILSLIQCLSLHDVLSFEESADLSVVTEAPIPSDENLVLRAALKLREAAGPEKGARISLLKKIPIAAGLGGGSSDAASTLLGLNELWKLGLTARELSDIAKGLGSDVPFFLNCPAASVGGRGEVVRQVLIKRPVTLLLLNPGIMVSAGWAYSALNEYEPSGDNVTGAAIGAIDAGDFDALAAMAANDLEGPVVAKYPQVAELKAKLVECGALFSAMSGSGPTVFGVFGQREEAEKAASRIDVRWSGVFETLVRAS